MKTKSLMAVAVAALILSSPAYADDADPKTVTPAWVTEQQLAQQAQAPQETPQQAQPQAETKPASTTNLFFIGYDYPTLSGPLATHLAKWASPFNFSLGFESFGASGSSFLSGLGLEFFVTPNDKGVRIQLNDMVMLGYSIELEKNVRLNLGARLGIGILDVADYNSANPSYMLLGGVAGPEASIYGMVAKDFWLWLRGRYTVGYYFALDSSGGGTNPIDAGGRTLNCLSLEAGLAFRM
jgi:opacity protein-like surface antigen